MKTIIKKAMITLCFSAAFALALGAANDVSAKQKFTYKLKKGTLTIKGKGEMPKKKNFKKNKKIKKVVIKSGVKSISNNAFKGCSKLTKITIPSSVKKIGVSAFKGTAIKKLTIPKKVKKIGNEFIDNCKNLDYLTIPGDYTITYSDGRECDFYKMDGTYLIQVKFNSKLNYRLCGYYNTLNFQTASSDTELSTIDGVVYTKDGSGLVRVPSQRTSLNIEDGCKTLYTAAISYITDGTNSNVCNLGSVNIPASVTKITNDNYNDLSYSYSDSTSTNKTNFKFADQSKLGIEDFVTLKNVFYIKPAKLASMLPTRIVYNEENKVYVGDGKYLVAGGEGVGFPEGIEVICERAFDNYQGEAIQTVVVPEGVREIRPYAFNRSSLVNIHLPDSLTSLGKYAFANSSVISVIIPKNIHTISNGLFDNCYALRDITFDGAITEIGKRAFESTKVNLNDILKTNGLKSINDHAFEWVTFKNITIPSTVERVGKYVFDLTSDESKKFITIEGSTAGFDPFAFGTNGFERATLSFSQGFNQALCSLNTSRSSKKKSVDIYISWIKVSDATGYDIKITKDKEGKKTVKAISAKYNLNSVKCNVKKKKKAKYVFIRPYKLVNGKKTYGIWTMKTF